MLLFDDDDKLLFAEWLTDESSDKWVYLGLIFFKILFQRLRQKFCLCRAIDRYNTDLDGQATFCGGRKITVLISL